MKNLFITSSIILLFCMSCKNSKNDESNDLIENDRSEIPEDFYEIQFESESNSAKIFNSDGSVFSQPDEDMNPEIHKSEDFNADKKEDLMIYLGACGTGGCVYGIFLNQYDNYYKLVFMDYLKGPDFKKDENGFLKISSYEEVEAYDPSRLYVTTFKFDQEKYTYLLDTSYISYDTLFINE